jgi:hypothetical protein
MALPSPSGVALFFRENPALTGWDESRGLSTLGKGGLGMHQIRLLVFRLFERRRLRDWFYTVVFIIFVPVG